MEEEVSYDISGKAAPAKQTSQARKLTHINPIQIFGIDNRERSILGVTGNNALTGFSVVAGDLNSDGIDDIIIGAPESEGILSKTSRSGWVYVIFGHKKFPAILDLKKHVDVGFWGGDNVGNNLLGHALTVADFNGDGISDLAIGVPQDNGGRFERIHSGAVYIIFGRTTFNKVVDLSKEADVTLIGADPGDRTGFSLTTGDFNGDNIGDLVMGAPGSAGDQNRTPGAGETYIIYGRPRFPKGIDLAKNWNSRIYGVEGTGFQVSLTEDRPNQSGFALAAADLNEDGRDDLIIGAPFANGLLNRDRDAGESYVIFGRGAFPKNIHLAHDADITLYGTGPDDQSGTSFYTGNFNGDSLSDLLISSPNAVRQTRSGSIQGLVHGIYGRTNHSKTYLLKSDADVIFKSDVHCAVAPYPEAVLKTLSFGKSMTGLDLNHDGNENLISGMPCSGGDNRRKLSGAIYFFPSRNEQKWLNPSAIFQPTKASAQELVGFALAKGDINGDGKTDILVGAPGMERSRKKSASGGIYILPGLADR